MSSSVVILTISALDSAPAILLVGPKGEKTLINCGEGCQRSFLESPGMRIRSVSRVCLTDLSHKTLGGLPGMILTSADTLDSTLKNVAQSITLGNESGPKKRKAPSADEDLGLVLVGPQGTKDFIGSLRHFMRRDKFKIQIHEGAYTQAESSQQRKPASGKKRGRRREVADSEAFLVQTIPFSHTVNGVGVEIVSFVFRTQPIQGKFMIDRAKAIGIPPGPLYAQLKNGKRITFIKDGEEVTVESHEVVAKGSAGVSVIVLYCPTIDILPQLQLSEVLNVFRDSEALPDCPLDLIIHLAPKDVFHNVSYTAWAKGFGDVANNIWVDSIDTMSGETTELSEPSPFQSARMGCLLRSLLDSDVYPPPQQDNSCASEPVVSELPNLIVGKRMMEYVLIPRNRKGFVRENIAAEDMRRKEGSVEAARLQVESSGADKLVTGIMQSGAPLTKEAGEAGTDQPSILFTGTGSALPCKHRNVTGICVNLDADKAVLLDCGEGTTGQLLRSRSTWDERKRLMKSIQAVWVSHPHADHHLGLLRLLEERNSLTNVPLLLIAPNSMKRFLLEYEKVNPSVRNSYNHVDCSKFVAQSSPEAETLDYLRSSAAIRSILTIPVNHCSSAFAIVLETTTFGRIAYSGDCRPSMRFAEQASGVDILIHEATFENGMEQEAVLKKHCTAGEALTVARRMNAKAVILTHFSQRYPRIPPLDVGQPPTPSEGDELASEKMQESVPVVFAFDMMRLTGPTMATAAKLTPALRLLYPDASSKDPKPVDELSAAQILSIPGLFAQHELL